MSDKRVIVLDQRDIVLLSHGSREALNAAANQLYKLAQQRVAQSPDKIDEEGEVMPRVWRFVFGEDEDDRSLKQNRFYWGVLLRQISEQARVAGQQYTADAWHELAKRQFLGYEVIKAPVAGRKRVQVYRRLRSTTDLTVKQMSEYLDAFIAFASDGLSVVFDFDPIEREAVRWTRAKRKARKPHEEAANV